MSTHPFAQVDVFATEPHSGNPLAVVLEADALGDDQMARLARWTHLSETTFVLEPTTTEADYRVRIFTPTGELPFAGHPTLGTCRAWLDHGGSARPDGTVVQECDAGLITVRVEEDRLAFRAPPLLRCGPVDPAERAAAVAALGLSEEDVVDAQWVDNGPGWLGLLLTDAAAVLRAELDPVGIADLKVTIIGPHAPGGPADVEVRAFARGIGEDPVTGSANAGLATWLVGSGVAPTSYVAAQGTRIGRRGRVHVEQDEGGIWVGGATTPTISGTVRC